MNLSISVTMQGKQVPPRLNSRRLYRTNVLLPVVAAGFLYVACGIPTLDYLEPPQVATVPTEFVSLDATMAFRYPQTSYNAGNPDFIGFELIYKIYAANIDNPTPWTSELISSGPIGTVDGFYHLTNTLHFQYLVPVQFDVETDTAQSFTPSPTIPAAVDDFGVYIISLDNTSIPQTDRPDEIVVFLDSIDDPISVLRRNAGQGADIVESAFRNDEGNVLVYATDYDVAAMYPTNSAFDQQQLGLFDGSADIYMAVYAVAVALDSDTGRPYYSVPQRLDRLDTETFPL